MSSLAKNVRAAAAISSLLLNLMLFLSGATFPLQMMPSFIQPVAKVLPLYYVIDLLRFLLHLEQRTGRSCTSRYVCGIHGTCRALLPLERGLTR